MKKAALALCLVLVFTFSSALQAFACWNAPEPFEIISDDGSKIFVFIPDEYGLDIAYAAIYEIINNEKQLVYSVEDLASFAYKSNFHFGADMMHFARVFPGHGTSAFEVFSYGVRTRVVMRSDFIEDYDSAKGFTSIGPMYTVIWRIEENSTQNTTITINTDEDNAILFDLATAKFTWENVSPLRYEALPEVSAYPITTAQNVPVTIIEANDEIVSEAISQTQNTPIVIWVIVGAVAAFMTVGVFILFPL